MTTDIASEAPPRPPYRISALFCGFAKMRRAWRIALPVILVNALIQVALLPLSYPETASLLGNLLGVLISLIALLVTAGVLAACALLSVEKRATMMSVIEILTARGARLSLWLLIVAVVFVAGFALYVVPGFVALALLCFVPLAALSAAGNPLTVNFSIIRRRAWRWLLTVILIFGMAALGWFVSGAIVILNAPLLGPLFVDLLWGLFGWWWLSALACIYVSATMDTAGAASTSEPARHTDKSDG